ncbi:ArfGap-domain-containing protein [Aureobasidium sp. EXF-3400]|nr:ArfGap-domain-containing protein [Aureobasidium sp. EXF-12344]KAI4782992.1 ArfGap-domain-containing protein [Aureobasidium sp. EXF-3400]
MSRRPAGPDRTMQNQQTLKSLVKLEGNKSCADCKRNKHPRWASWNLGIFICIRCSGIHRGMGTHISRVKSVDLDSWTDEQLQSMLKWGNTRANKYWEAKLAPGHVPAEAKIENFIRTKYDSKRWTMDGPIPDPSTLGGEGGDEDVPLSVVQEKAKLDRSASLRNASMNSGPAAPPAAPRAPAPVIDLFGDDLTPARASTAEPTIASRPPPQQQQKAPAAPPKQTRPGDSLLGLDFFGTSQTAPPARPASAASGVATAGSNPRSDLKQSILSLYASAPKPAPVQQPQSSSNAFGGFTSPPLHSPAASTSSFGGMADAFGGLNFGGTPVPQQPQQQPKPSAFSNLTSPVSRTSSLSGGSFFDAKPAPPPKPSAAPAPKPQPARMSSGFGDFGDFTSAPSPAPAPMSTKSPVPVSSGMGDLFDMSAPAPPAKPATSTSASAFNLSSPVPPPKPAPVPAMSGLDNMDAWGSNNAWSTPEPAAPAPPTTSYKAPTSTTTSYKAPAMTSVSNDDDFGGWGSNEGTSSSKPTVSQDDDFGGWSSAPAPTASTSNNKAPASDDLFGNVWG